jgi:hypothetical protein
MIMTRWNRLSTAALVALAAVFATAPGALAGDDATPQAAASEPAAGAPQPAQEPAAAETPEGEAQVPGMIVAIDPETGAIRQPTAEERRALVEEFVRRFGRVPGARSVQPQQQPLAGGGTMAALDPGLHDFAVARIDADGNLVTDCVHGSEAADAWIAAEPAPVAREER